MARNNLVTRQQGVGTFVNSPDRSVKTTSLFGYIDDIHPHINLKLLKVEQRTPPASIATTMRLAEGEHCTCYVSVNQAGREPLSYIEDFFPADSARYLNENDFLGRVPPTRVLEMRSGRIFAYAEQTMGAVASPPHIAKALGLPVGHPIMRMERVYFAVGDIVLHATEAHYHPERYQYSVRVIPRANTTPRQVQLP
jgi:GntR family transcriptional regulator